MLRILTLLSVAFVFSFISASSSLLQAGSQSRPKAIEVSRGGYHARITVTMQRVPKGDGWWGTPDDDRPESVVIRIELRRGTKKMFVPVSAWVGLVDVNRESVSIVPAKNGCALKFQGADAGAGYTATLVVKGNQVVERTIRAGEFSDECWERTVYHYIPDDGR